MRTAALFAACALGLVMGVSPVIAAASGQSRDGHNRRVRVHNQTGWTITRFYAADARTHSWVQYPLGAPAMDPGRSWVLNIDDGSGACLYDLKAEFANGQNLVRPAVNVCVVADYYYLR